MRLHFILFWFLNYLILLSITPKFLQFFGIITIIIMAANIDWLNVKTLSKCFAYIISLDPHDNPRRQVLLSAS